MILLRASAVLPISRPPVRDGVVAVSGGRIARVAAWRSLSATDKRRVLDLGPSVLLPGLVNAHCHLDYTDMAGEFLPPRCFIDWLKTITEAKAGWTHEDFARSWTNGAEMLCRTGTTLVGDIEAVPQVLQAARKTTPLRVVSMFEMIGIKPGRSPGAILTEALGWCERLRAAPHRCGLSPHAPYSTTPGLLETSASTARRRRLPVAIHVAESAAEYEMFAQGRGEMFDWLRRSGRDMSDCGGLTPVEHLDRCGALNHRVIAVHANYLGHSDPTLLARRGASVAHCPRSHLYFQHARFKYRELEHAGVNVCLGTDSLASVKKERRATIELNLFEEMRAARAAEPGLSAKKALQMATINGARALGFAGRAGEISPGGLADLIAVPLQGGLEDAYESVLSHHGPVSAMMIAGRWVQAPPVH
jgi:cytosine/adenosine deaminase-related metal-dependent hydrolase